MVGYSMAWYWRDMAIIPDTGRVNVFLESGGPVPVGRQLDNNFPIDALLTSSGHRV